MLKKFIAYTGLSFNLIFLKKFDFYFFIFIAQIFYFFLFLKEGSVALHKDKNLIILLFFSQFYTAFFEELIFRGFIQSYLKDLLKNNNILAIAISSLIFSIFHILNHNLLWAIGVFFPGLIFGYLREKYSLWAGITLHFIYNFEYFLLFS